MKFKNRLKSLRVFQNLEQEQLAKKCGLSATTLSHYETGRREPGLRNLIKLKKGLCVSYHELLDRVTT